MVRSLNYLAVACYCVSLELLAMATAYDFAFRPPLACTRFTTPFSNCRPGRSLLVHHNTRRCSRTFVSGSGASSRGACGDDESTSWLPASPRVGGQGNKTKYVTSYK